MKTYGHGDCTICGKHDYLTPLHGGKGGPPCCLLCIGKWHAEHGRRIKRGRIVVRAIRAYLDAGGKYHDIEKLRLTACGHEVFSLDPLGYMAGIAAIGQDETELNAELLADALRLTHPDRHAPEHRDVPGVRRHGSSPLLRRLQGRIRPAARTRA